MAKLTVIAPVLAVLTVSAADNLPPGWYENTWNGYQPYPTYETVEGATGTRDAIHISDIGSKHGCGIIREKKDAIADGDRYLITFYAKGSGKACVNYNVYNAGGGWIVSLGSQNFELTDEWTLHEIEYRISDRLLADGKKAGFVSPFLHGSKGSEVWLSDIESMVCKGGDQSGMLPEVYELREKKASFFENFEKGVKGGRELVTDVVQGTLDKTKVGVYRVDKGELRLPFSASSVSITGKDRALSFGSRLYSLKGSFTTTAGFGGRGIELVLKASDKRLKTITGTLLDGDKEVSHFRLPRRILPADIRLDLNAEGGWAVEVNSLTDSSTRRYRGRLNASLNGGAHVVWKLAAEEGANGGVAVDNLEVAASMVVKRDREVPIILDHDLEFDPEKAGWPLVMQDDFDGAEIDWTKWYFPHYAGSHPECVHTDGEGHLVIEARADAEKRRIYTDGIWSNARLEYGYFEARLKFTHLPGWWAAFWMYGGIDSNPFLDGFEIDIFEDYYTRSKDKPGENAGILDHNTHVNLGPITKSRNFTSMIPGDREGWHTIAAKWTPFEISYYMDGKIMESRGQAGHGRYPTVTFDAVSHFAGISPLQVICSGQGREIPPGVDLSIYPEKFYIDRVRVFAYPQPEGEFPKIAWTKGPKEQAMVKPGTILDFGVEVKSAAKTKAKINCVYLFDNGYLVDWKKEPPYDFKLRFSKEAYEYTNYAKPGRQGQKPDFNDGHAHVFVAYAQDEKGRVSHTGTLWRIPVEVKEAAFEDRPQTLPGKLEAVRFDTLGRGRSVFTRDGENKHWHKFRPDDTVTCTKSGYVGIIYGGDWLNYTVDIAKAGRYRVKISAGSGVKQYLGVRLLLDGYEIGDLRLDGFTDWQKVRGFRDDMGEIEVSLPAGRHVLTVGAEGGLTFQYLEVIP